MRTPPRAGAASVDRIDASRSTSRSPRPWRSRGPTPPRSPPRGARGQADHGRVAHPWAEPRKDHTFQADRQFETLGTDSVIVPAISVARRSPDGVRLPDPELDRDRGRHRRPAAVEGEEAARAGASIRRTPPVRRPGVPDALEGPLRGARADGARRAECQHDLAAAGSDRRRLHAQGEQPPALDPREPVGQRSAPVADAGRGRPVPSASTATTAYAGRDSGSASPSTKEDSSVRPICVPSRDTRYSVAPSTGVQVTESFHESGFAVHRPARSTASPLTDSGRVTAGEAEGVAAAATSGSASRTAIEIAIDPATTAPSRPPTRQGAVATPRRWNGVWRGRVERGPGRRRSSFAPIVVLLP